MNFAWFVYYLLAIATIVISIASIIFAVFLFAAMMSVCKEYDEFNEKECTDCGKQLMLFKSSITVDIDTGKIKKEKHTWICPECGRKVVVTTRAVDRKSFKHASENEIETFHSDILSQNGKTITHRKSYKIY